MMLVVVVMVVVCVLQDPLSMLTRQLDGPDLDRFIGKTAFLLGLEVHHAPLDADTVVAILVVLGVSSQRGHECCGGGTGESKGVGGGECKEVCDAGEVEAEEGPWRSTSFCEERAQP